MPRPAFLAVLVALLASACASGPLVRIADRPANHAWWLRATFEPRGAHLRGLPVRSLDAAGCAVDELTPARFAAIEHADGRDAFAAGAAKYAIGGPEVEGRATEAVLAVFRECTGPTGTALVLLARRGGEPPTPLAIEELASPAAYAMLDAGEAGRIVVVHCQECDAIDEYEWDPQARRLVQVPSERGD